MSSPFLPLEQFRVLFVRVQVMLNRGFEIFGADMCLSLDRIQPRGGIRGEVDGAA